MAGVPFSCVEFFTEESWNLLSCVSFVENELCVLLSLYGFQAPSVLISLAANLKLCSRQSGIRAEPAAQQGWQDIASFLLFGSDVDGHLNEVEIELPVVYPNFLPTKWHVGVSVPWRQEQDRFFVCVAYPHSECTV